MFPIIIALKSSNKKRMKGKEGKTENHTSCNKRKIMKGKEGKTEKPYLVHLIDPACVI